MYRLFAALVLCGAMFLISPASAQAHGGCGYGGGYGYSGGYGGYRNVGYYPAARVINTGFYGPSFGPRYSGFSGYGGYRGYGGGYRGYRGGGSFISIGFGF